jgi:hypothetical protein
MSVLDEERHAVLIANLEQVSYQTGIPKHYITTSAKEIMSVESLEPLLVPKYANKSVLFLGDYNQSYENMLAYGGVLIRNYLDVRVLSMQHALDYYVNGELPTPRVFMIPDFFVGGDKTPKWIISRIIGLLTECKSNDTRLILFASSRKQLEKEYGDLILKFVDENFVQVTV